MLLKYESNDFVPSVYKEGKLYPVCSTGQCLSLFIITSALLTSLDSGVNVYQALAAKDFVWLLMQSALHAAAL